MALKLLKKKNYLAMIRNAAKGRNWMFRNFYVEEDDQSIDILKDGKLSCAVFVSSVLYLHHLITDIHATVESTLVDMNKFGWLEIKDLKPGAVIVWEKILGESDGKMHSHIGFYIGDNLAVSNSSNDVGVIFEHGFDYDGKRKIEKIYWHPELDED